MAEIHSKIKTCPNGHPYDPSRYDSCPYCSSGSFIPSLDPFGGMPGHATPTEDGFSATTDPTSFSQNVPSDGSERRVANGWIFVAPGSPTQAQMTAAQNDLYGRVVSDTTRPFVLKPGSTYQFCMTLVSGSNPPNCITDDPEHYTVTYTGNSGRNYYYKITAKPGAAGANVYSTVPGADPVLQCKLLAAG